MIPTSLIQNIATIYSILASFPTAWIMNIATVCFFLASFPQMLKSYKRRKTALQDFSLPSWMICTTGVILMGIVGFKVGAWVTVVIEAWHVFYHIATIYWIVRYRRRS